VSAESPKQAYANRGMNGSGTAACGVELTSRCKFDLFDLAVFDVAPRSSAPATFVEIAVAIDRIHLRAAALREMFSAKV
jgi:hypothetical protein